MREFKTERVSGDEARERFNKLSPEQIKKSNYFRSFAQAHSSAFRPHFRKGETLGRAARKEGWINVSEHCLVEGVVADVISELIKLTANERKEVVTAALMHDWNKKAETISQKEDSERNDGSQKSYQSTKEAEKAYLKVLEVPASIQQLIDAIIPKTVYGPIGLLDEIVWYADTIVSQTEIKPLRERMDQTERGWDGRRYDPERAARYKAMAESSRAQYGGKTLFDVQREVADRVEPHLAKLAGFDGPPEKFPAFLKEKIHERIESFSNK